MRILTITLIILLSLFKIEPSKAQYLTEIIDPNIKTVQVFANQTPSTFPCIYINNNEQISIEFDDINTKYSRYLRYKIIHCDENWNDEQLFPSTFIEGFQDQPISGYTPSNNTSIRYNHYSINFPNSDIKPKISGNYLVIIYENDPETPLLKAGFMVAEKLAMQAAGVTIPTSNNYETSHQISLTVSHLIPNVVNPTQEFKAIEWKNYVEIPDVLQPKIVTYDQRILKYSRPDKNIIPAGNEYRTIDIRDAHYISTNAVSVKQTQGEYFVLLRPDKPRNNQPYTKNYDHNGKFIITGTNTPSPSVDCDYYNVMFSLQCPNYGSDYDVYIEGELTGWKPSNNSKMIYNSTTGCYEIPLLLKQGHYSYLYTVRNNKGEEIENLSPEGNFSETENSYQICTYYKGIRDTYTRLVAISTLEQGKNTKK